MTKPKFEIKLKEGLIGLSFGSTAEEIINFFGEPSDKEILEKESEEELDTELWYYDDDNFSLFLEGEPELVLTSIEVSNEDTLLFGKKIFDLNEVQIIELMKSNGYEEVDIEDEEWGEKLVSFEDALIDFYFEEGKLISVNWSMEFED